MISEICSVMRLMDIACKARETARRDCHYAAKEGDLANAERALAEMQWMDGEIAAFLKTLHAITKNAGINYYWQRYEEYKKLQTSPSQAQQ